MSPHNPTTPQNHNTTHPPELTVYETKPRWLPVLRRLLRDTPCRIRGVGRNADLQVMLERDDRVPRPKVVLLGLPGQEANVIELLDRWSSGRGGPIARRQVRRIAVGKSEHAELEWLLREIGLHSYVEEPFPPERLADLVRHHWELASCGSP